MRSTILACLAIGLATAALAQEPPSTPAPAPLQLGAAPLAIWTKPQGLQPLPDSVLTRLPAARPAPAPQSMVDRLIAAVLDWRNSHSWLFLVALLMLGGMVREMMRGAEESIGIVALAIGVVVAATLGLAALFLRMEPHAEGEAAHTLALWKAALWLVGILIAAGLGYAARRNWPLVHGGVLVIAGAGVTLHYIVSSHGAIVEAVVGLFVAIDGIEKFAEASEKRSKDGKAPREKVKAAS